MIHQKTSMWCLPISRASPGVIFVRILPGHFSFWRCERPDEQSAGDESAGMGPPGYSGRLPRPGAVDGVNDLERSIEQLRDEPEAQKKNRGDFNEEWNEEDRDEGDDPRTGIEQQIGAQHAGNRSAGAEA